MSRSSLRSPILLTSYYRPSLPTTAIMPTSSTYRSTISNNKYNSSVTGARPLPPGPGPIYNSSLTRLRQNRASDLPSLNAGPVRANHATTTYSSSYGSYAAPKNTDYTSSLGNRLSRRSLSYDNLTSSIGSLKVAVGGGAADYTSKTRQRRLSSESSTDTKTRVSIYSPIERRGSLTGYDATRTQTRRDSVHDSTRTPARRDSLNGYDSTRTPARRDSVHDSTSSTQRIRRDSLGSNSSTSRVISGTEFKSSSSITKSSTAAREHNGLTGLKNLGNTCFMNSITQCLSNCRPLLEYCLNDDYHLDINTTSSTMKGALFKAYANLMSEMWSGQTSSTSPNTFKSKMTRYAPRFSGYGQHDSQEFLRYALEGLHEDVNRVGERVRPELPDDAAEDRMKDSEKSLLYWKRYLRLGNSKIIDLFVGQLKSTLRCTECGYCSTTFDPFWDLSLPIHKRTTKVQLNECFRLFTQEEILDGDEKPTCAKCKTRRKCLKSFSIQRFPKILVLHLKRFSQDRYRGKLATLVDFPINGLDLSSFAADSGSKSGARYDLFGVSNHSGTTYSGHYTAYCKHPYTGIWHEYNDARVSSMSSREVVSSEGYVLFYELLTH
ncbi:ubiquitin carboxyl-terminal hydrolase 2-like [Tubulanus polymorphus]|uniref:ubiquitin carboxyl-terminal hydrolase 2-like n=1 Tax=Tubulanus polymorphus TaxID=672921 RepID=UPI003DA6B2CF